jgi:hypothetical protein
VWLSPRRKIGVSTHHLHRDIAWNKLGSVSTSGADPHATEIGVDEIVRFNGDAPALPDLRLISRGCLKIINVIA